MTVRSRQWLSPASALGALFISALMPAQSLAHGYISEPPSRSKLCATGDNNQCGAIQWEPQSVEGPDRYPQSGPADGKIASGGNAGFAPLDVQTSSRWSKTAVAGGPIEIEWTFTAPHVSRDFRYFITKPGWNPNEPLTRNSFSSDPFCTHDGKQQQPANPLRHNCYLPANLSGYHVLLGVWDVGDTVNSFYQVVDLTIAGGDAPKWTDIGDINPGRQLIAGDTVILRLFDQQQQVTSMSWTYAGGDDWTQAFASWINQQQQGVFAGVLDAQGNITPVAGKNDLWVASDSSLQRAELSFDLIDRDPVSLSLNNLQKSYQLDGSALALNLDITSEQPLNLDVSLYRQQQLLSSKKAELNQQLMLPLNVNNPLPGDYRLVIAASNDQGVTEQFSYDFNVTLSNSDYDYVYPNQHAQYRAGDRVLAEDGRVYQCKPHPYAGWCRIYRAADPAYAPGVGRAWQDAWVLIGQ
ncbi:GlcNAc-binding protein A [Bacterioplanes sanyensis]|uniref:N-acetylglucosamine-binding protein GbpA n=1 Tax=Bacterioplanes sanyensis TaxID=1249553 RepID=UPI001676619A|nr:N-acetylglucosamine-binding protein GbpA [Bacterioplanes sanyensis]GGY46724.1 GlcNAc-binding protein A [Bacterioplanes sanyensis]